MKVETFEAGCAVTVSVCLIVFLVSMHFGFWDWWRGLNEVEKVATNFESSYAPDASRPVRPGDPAWPRLLKLIAAYSPASLPMHKEPKVLVRSVAIDSKKLDVG